MKILFAILLTITVVSSVPAQRRSRKVQTDFGSETPLTRPIKIPGNVLAELVKLENEQLMRCNDNRKTGLVKYFKASAIDINGDGLQDLIVQAGEYCLQGAHNTPMWIFTRIGQRLAPGHELIFTTRTDWLEILNSSSNGYRDIKTAGHTALEVFTTVWKFDGATYQPRACTVENLQTKRISRVSCSQ